MSTDPLDDALFDLEAPPPVSLADRFGVPPMSVLDRRSGRWRDRRRQWLTLGIRSEIGRDQDLIFGGGQSEVSQMHRAYQGGTSIFDPVLCELAYRRLSRPGDRILDPFAGGAVRGAALRAERPFRASRKLTRVHQYMLIAVRGDERRAAVILEAA